MVSLDKKGTNCSGQLENAKKGSGSTENWQKLSNFILKA